MSLEIIMSNPFRRGLNRARFQGNMHCPYCSKHVDPNTTPIGFETDKDKIVLKENLGPFIKVYKCKQCGGEWRYDVARQKSNPYSSFKRGLKLPGLSYTGGVPLLKG